MPHPPCGQKTVFPKERFTAAKGALRKPSGPEGGAVAEYQPVKQEVTAHARAPSPVGGMRAGHRLPCTHALSSG